MAETERTIQIIEQDGSIVRILGSSGRGSIEVIAELSWEGQILVLRGLHADGSGPGALGLTELRAYAREFARQQSAEAIIIYGGVRTSGARPGKVPRPIVIQVRE